MITPIDADMDNVAAVGTVSAGTVVSWFNSDGTENTTMSEFRGQDLGRPE